MPTKDDLKVWWVPQMPMTAFEVPVANVVEGKLILETLANYDLFQLKHHIKPDYANVGGLVIWDGDEWIDWYSVDGEDIDFYEIDALREQVPECQY